MGKASLGHGTLAKASTCTSRSGLVDCGIGTTARSDIAGRVTSDLIVNGAYIPAVAQRGLGRDRRCSTGGPGDLRPRQILDHIPVLVGLLDVLLGLRFLLSHLSPFFNGEIFAGKFATQEARNHLLGGLGKAGFR